MMITGDTRVAAVVGSPVTHSLSPALHNAAFAASGLDWIFVALETSTGEAVVPAMRALGLGGLAVTTPHKQVVARSVDAVDPAAASLDSVNTVCLRPDGSTFGASTDGAGFVASLRAAGVEPEGASVVVLGAGGAARSIVDALGRCGVADLAVVNRSPGPAEAAASLAAMGRVADAAAITTADIVVNATSVGMGTRELPCDPSLLHRHQVVADIVYHPLDTALLTAARQAGATVVDGLGMLVHQAVLQQQLWTGVTPDPAPMRAAAEAELVARRR
jgi:shikimate dehydrogenase